MAHDALLWRTACLRHALYHIDFPSIHFRRHDSNASSSQNPRISAAECKAIRNTIEIYTDCIQRMQSLDLGEEEQKLLTRLLVWLEKRRALYESPSLFKWIALIRYLKYYKQLRTYIKELNAIIYSHAGGQHEGRKEH